MDGLVEPKYNTAFFVAFFAGRVNGCGTRVFAVSNFFSSRSMLST